MVLNEECENGRKEYAEKNVILHTKCLEVLDRFLFIQLI